METDDVAIDAIDAIDTPVGRLSVAVTRTGVARVRWAEPEEFVAGSSLRVVADGARVAPVMEQLAQYFAGRRQAFEVPLDWRFTSGVQRTVLAALYTTVPFGSSVTYGELAERSGTSVPARGVGTIMGSNPLPVLVPCHRVLAHDGLGGYSGGTGVEVKRWLLALEGVLPAMLI